MSTYNLTKVTEFAQLIISQYLNKGDTVVDCTMGNGYDTLFLAKMVGESGKVISFDIQEAAIQKTRLLLKDNKYTKSVVLINDSHENVDLYVKEDISVAMFNLGYLPGGDNGITTKAPSTLASIEKCLMLLKPMGAISLVIYYGHQEGISEKNNVLKYVETLSSKLFHVIKSEYINQTNNPPLIVTIIKKGKKSSYKLKEVSNEKS